MTAMMGILERSTYPAKQSCRISTRRLLEPKGYMLPSEAVPSWHRQLATMKSGHRIVGRNLVLEAL